MAKTANFYVALYLFYFMDERISGKPLSIFVQDSEGSSPATPIEAKLDDLWYKIYRGKDADKAMIEGDMKPDPVISDRQRRAVSSLERHKWPSNSIPYVFDETPGQSISQNDRVAILDGLRHIEERTCLKFVNRTTEEYYIRFVAKQGCFSFIGRVRQTNGQELSIGTNCAVLSVIVHEVLHALGFIHEHTRLDRDTYVIINETNIQPEFLDQFKKYNEIENPLSVTTLDTSYDKQSVMHYSQFTFAKPGAVFRKEDMTIYSRADYKETLGNRNGLSDMDSFRVNTHYNCPTTPPPTTTNSTTNTTTTTTTETSTITSTKTTITTPKPTTTDKKDTTTIASSPVITSRPDSGETTTSEPVTIRESTRTSSTGSTITSTTSTTITTPKPTTTDKKDTTTITSSPVMTSKPDSGETTTNEPVTIRESTRTSSTGSTVTREVKLTVTQRIYILYQLVNLLF